MRDLRKIEEYRVITGPLATLQEEFPNGGMFVLPISASNFAVCVVSDGKYKKEDTGWEHVAVHIVYEFGRKKKRRSRAIKQDELQKVRDVFWEPEDNVIQCFSKESLEGDGWEVNVHLWKSKKKTIKSFPSARDYMASLRYIRSASSSNSEIPA
tara:strand:- start:4392 stop:4853 length:462 start_codon:yes stop_codon:yes gene_type:complete